MYKVVTCMGQFKKCQRPEQGHFECTFKDLEATKVTGHSNYFKLHCFAQYTSEGFKHLILYLISLHTFQAWPDTSNGKNQCTA